MLSTINYLGKYVHYIARSNFQIQKHSESTLKIQNYPENKTGTGKPKRKTERGIEPAELEGNGGPEDTCP